MLTKTRFKLHTPKYLSIIAIDMHNKLNLYLFNHVTKIYVLNLRYIDICKSHNFMGSSRCKITNTRFLFQNKTPHS